MEPYKILLADDHSLLREAIRKSVEGVPGLQVVGEVGDGIELQRFLQTSVPDMVILDITMPHVQGLEAAKEIKARYPGVKILILTMHKSGEYLRRALAAGVEGYLLKENVLADLIAAIEAIRRGASYISSLLTTRILRKAPSSRFGGNLLSDREIEVLTLIAQGKSSKEIADSLSISIMTVYNHRVNIKNKLNIKKTAQLIRFALEQGYV